MAQDEFTSIPGLEAKHQKVLGEQLQVTTFKGLVGTHREAIRRAMGRLRPRPSLEVIAEWQDHARDRLAGVGSDTSDWARAATFVVSFEQLDRDGTIARRLALEQTEIEPEQDLKIWPSWECEGICEWMRDLLRQTVVDQDAASEAEEVSTGKTPSDAVTSDASTPEDGVVDLRIDRVTVIDATGRVEVIWEEVVTSTHGADSVSPARLAVAVSGPEHDPDVHVAIQFDRPRTLGHSPSKPVVLRGRGIAEFDLADVPIGQHEVSVLAWTPDGSASPCVVKLPRFTVSGG